MSNYPQGGPHNNGSFTTGDHAAKLEAAAFNGTSPAKRPTSKWIKFGVPAAVIAVIIGAVLGGVLGSRAAKNKDGGSGKGGPGGSTGGNNANADPSGTGGGTAALARFATATDSQYMIPIYPSTVGRFLFPRSTDYG